MEITSSNDEDMPDKHQFFTRYPNSMSNFLWKWIKMSIKG